MLAAAARRDEVSRCGRAQSDWPVNLAALTLQILQHHDEYWEFPHFLAVNGRQ
jgi:hypothetical protein